MNFESLHTGSGKSRIARKLILAIIVFSSCVTLVITAVQLFVDYKSDVGAIHSEIEIIRHHHLDTISHSIWIFDPTATQIILDSLVKHQDIEFIRARVDKQTTWQAGAITANRQIRETIPLRYLSAGKMTAIGELEIVASLDSVYGRLIRKGLFILLGNAIKTFLVAFFSLAIFQYLVTRHLITLGDYAKSIRPGQPAPPLSLDRPKSERPDDELDYVVAAFHSMQKSLTDEIIKISQAEEQTRKSTQLLRDVMDGTTDAVFLKDIEGRYLMANTAACQAMGKSEETVRGKTDQELFPSQSAAVINTIDTKVMESGNPCIAEERLQTTDGDTYWLANKSPYRDKNGAVIGLIGISRNITESKRLEKENRELEARLIQAQKMEAIGTLAGGIAHDFNNILAAILGFTDMARDEAEPHSTLAKDLEQIWISGHRAKELVQQILAFSRNSQAEIIPFQPAIIIKEALRMLRASLPTTIEVKQDIDPHCGVIMGDPTQIHQTMMNLCTNAYHALEEKGGRLTVTLRNSEVRAEDFPHEPEPASGAYVELTVEDDGPGIDPTVRENIFDPYFTTKKVGKGTGMGLAIVHGIVKECGGLISVESSPGQGAAFHLYFPRVTEPPAMEEPHQQPPPRAVGKESILFVDDEKFLIDMGTTMLERLGYSVTSRTSGLEALETFRNQPDSFDLVITDQTMPGLTGAELARKLLEIKPDLPIILCTGFSTLISEEKAKAMGIREFAMKPLVKKDIALLIRTILDKEYRHKR